MPAEAKILIVDDEMPVCRSLASALSGRNYIVDTACNGEEALEKERENHYDVVVADLMMPGISGMDLLKALKEDRPEVVVIMVTGYPSIKTAVQSVKLGAFDYLPKPFTPDELRTLVSRALLKRKFLEEESVGTVTELIDVSIPEGTYVIPEYSWARLDEDGNVRVGIHHVLLRIFRNIKSIEFPELGKTKSQGEAFLSITDDQEKEYRLWSPVSGKVIAVNNGLADNLTDLMKDPYENGWVMLVSPSHLEKDLENLQLLAPPK